VVSFVFSLVVTAALCVGIVLYGRRRPVGAPLTWGEAMAAATLVFFLLFLAYGIVPHQWLTLADNELQWRADRIVAGPGGVVEALPFTVTYRVLRDLVAVAIYGVFLGLHVGLWMLWQNRGRQKPKEIETSSYGRPLVKA
jgi:hypothetical protein